MACATKHHIITPAVIKLQIYKNRHKIRERGICIGLMSPAMFAQSFKRENTSRQIIYVY